MGGTGVNGEGVLLFENVGPSGLGLDGGLSFENVALMSWSYLPSAREGSSLRMVALMS